MKKILLILSIFMTISCCASTSTTSTTPTYYSAKGTLPQLTSEKVQQCKVVERWNIYVMSVPANLARFEAFEGYDNLAAIVFWTEGESEEIKGYSAKVAFLHYIKYLNRISEGATWTGKLIKVERSIADERGSQDVFYYSLTETKPEQVKEE